MREEYLEVYFTTPYRNNDSWQAFVSTQYPSSISKKIYKARIKLPSEIVEIEQLEDTVAESEANEQ